MKKKLCGMLIFLHLLIVSLLASACSQGTTSPQSPRTELPPANTPYPVKLPSLTLGNHQNIVYMLNTITASTDPVALLERFDTSTQKTTEISKISNGQIQEAQLSADGQWILFIARLIDHDELRLVRLDGKNEQMLLSSLPYGAIAHVLWSPNQQFIVFDQEPPQTGPYITYLLDIAHNHLQAELVPPDQEGSLSYIPRQWLDNSHVLLIGQGPYDFSASPQNIYLLDTGKGANQQAAQLQQVSSGSQRCVDFDGSNDGAQLFLSTCTSTGVGGQQGPSTISVQPSTGGPTKTIFTSQTMVISQVRIANFQTLLFVMGNSIWKVNADSTGLTHLGLASNMFLLCAVEQNRCSNVSPDGSMYALGAFNADDTTSIYEGSLSGGAPRQVAQIQSLYWSFVGWTML